MATTASARPSLTLGYTLQASDSYATVSETAIVGYTNQQWTNGTGTGNMTAQSMQINVLRSLKWAMANGAVEKLIQRTATLRSAQEDHLTLFL